MKHNICWYQSPQILHDVIGNEEREWMAADVYAYGVILYELFMKKPPWDFNREAEIKDAVCSGTRPEFPQEFVKTPMAQLITRCWEGIVSDRPTFNDIVNVLNSSSSIQSKTSVNHRTSAVYGPPQSNQSTRVSASHHPHSNQSSTAPPNNAGPSKTTHNTSTRVTAQTIQKQNGS